jgi:formamidopyrimidine-DNA glycosylase
MPELPEVEALARFLTGRLQGTRVADVALASLSAIKTFAPSITELVDRHVAEVTRHGKFLDMATVGGPHLVWHLSLGGWVQWSDEILTTRVKPGKSPLALRMSFVTDDGEPAGRMDITEYGTHKRLAIYVVNDPAEVPGISRLGPDALEITEADFAAIISAAGRSQIKGVLRDQSTIAGIGNAYSDEILHSAKLSPFHPSSTLTSEQVHLLYEAMRAELNTAVENSVGHGTGTLKAEKKANLAVHGRTGEKCPVCGDVVREVSFADRSLQYCATCQTGGRPLADRRMSKLLK